MLIGHVNADDNVPCTVPGPHASPEALAKYGKEPLDMIVANDEAEIDKLLSTNSITGEEVLILASAVGNLALVSKLLARGVSPNAQYADGNSALGASITYGCPPVTETLLEAGADPNVKDELGRTPLFFAVALQDIRLVKLLLDRGADASEIYYGMSLLDIAKNGKDRQLELMLKQAIDGE